MRKCNLHLQNYKTDLSFSIELQEININVCEEYKTEREARDENLPARRVDLFKMKFHVFMQYCFIKMTFWHQLELIRHRISLVCVIFSRKKCQIRCIIKIRKLLINAKCSCPKVVQLQNNIT